MKKMRIAIILLFLSQFTFAQKAITVEKSGVGKPIVFLPGFATPGSVWDETIQHLNGSYESHTISYAGFNGLESIGTPWYETIKNQLIQYIKNEHLTNVTLIGHSMGGNLAIDVATELPEQIRGLILIESIPCMRDIMMPDVPASSLQYDSPYNNQIIAMSDEDFRKMAIEMSQSMTNVPSKVELITNWLVRADRKTYAYGYTDLLKLDLRDKLSQIHIQTLILGGSFPSTDIENANLEKQYMNLKNKEILNVEGSKHFIMFDQPEWLYTQINKYLSQYAQ